jgi:hypothetical protein
MGHSPYSPEEYGLGDRRGREIGVPVGSVVENSLGKHRLGRPDHVGGTPLIGPTTDHFVPRTFGSDGDPAVDPDVASGTGGGQRVGPTTAASAIASNGLPAEGSWDQPATVSIRPSCNVVSHS